MVKLVFTGTQNSDSTDHKLEVFVNAAKEIYIGISDENQFTGGSYICLDKSTAIKFHRELKKQISFINESDNIWDELTRKSRENG
jgi:hypothetical protein